MRAGGLGHQGRVRGWVRHAAGFVDVRRVARVGWLGRQSVFEKLVR